MAYRPFMAFAMPLAILIAAYVLVPRLSQLPPTLLGLNVYGPYIFLAVAMLVSLAFARSRVLLAVIWLTAAYAAYRVLLYSGLESRAAHAVYDGLCVLLPLNLGALSWLKERGAFNAYGARRAAAMVLQLLLIAGAAALVAPGLWLQVQLADPAFVPVSPVSQLGMAALATGAAASLAAWWRTRSAIDLGLAGAIAAFGIAAHRISATDHYALFISAAALILAIAVLQDTFRMAFRDELTGLPSRRALNERLAGLGTRYVVAMVDVDHFKNFNDTYGHDLGDQVLKMVAAHLAQFAGGKAYRYGGEEFTIVCPGTTIAEAVPALDALRRTIGDYRLALRGTDRPVQAKRGKPRRGSRRADTGVAVTVSIGVAECNERQARPEAVIQAADKALYRAKHKGRDQVSR
jgi:diguanylate cyclase (GGDEF)-like protein